MDDLLSVDRWSWMVWNNEDWRRKQEAPFRKLVAWLAKDSDTLRSLSSLKTVYITSPREVDVVFHVQTDT